MATRQSIYRIPEQQLADVRRAFSEMMTLRDERGYQYFAGIHGLPLPIFCQHGNLLFLPWHRAYLYFLELAMQDRVPGVAIPWWDWTSTQAHQSGIPQAYADAQVNGQSNPLYDAPVQLTSDDIQLVRQRLPGTITQGDNPRTLRDSDLPDELPRNTTIESILNAPTFSDFSTRLENVHNDVHVWAGGTMSAVPMAGFDPIFYAHHAMIDRLWYLWQSRHTGVNPPNNILNQVLAPFPLTVAQTINIGTLGYDYAVSVVG
jgi:tyrosinase